MSSTSVQIQSGRRHAVLLIAADEWRRFHRNRVSVAAALLVLLLALTSALTSYRQWDNFSAQQNQFNERNQREFEAQPDRNPHRMVHYGQFLFRPPGALAFFDFGIDDFSGSMIYLEGHRQNSANFSNARESSSLTRFGRFTPAFTLQLLFPLLIIFLAFNCITREREHGSLRLLLAQNISGFTLAGGKLLGQSCIAVVIAAPLLLTPLLLAGINTASLLLCASYLAYLLFWVVLSVAVSLWLRRSRDALLLLIAAWATATILVPRVSAQWANSAAMLPTRFETAIRIHHDLMQIGDSHNPDDPYYAKFKAETLARYGVSRVEDLPVDYGGLLLTEGERQTSELFARYAAEAEQVEDRQSHLVDRFGVVSPLLPLRRLSMALAGTDLAAQREFLRAVEAHRYGFVQALNQIQVEHVRSKGQRVSHTHWADLPRFAYQRPDFSGDTAAQISSSMRTLIGWLTAALLLLAWRSQRLLKGKQ